MKFFLSKIIDIIDFFENLFSKEPLDHEKIENILNVDFEVYTDTGYKKVSEINFTKPFKNLKIETENGKKLIGSGGHIIVREGYIYDIMSNLKVGDKIITIDGLEKIKKIKKSFIKSNMIDLSVESNDNLYYTNDILSHNTISTSIYILWYVMFSDDKGVMIVANKKDTTVEILDKIKNIYKHLPFYLKKGVTNWAQSKVSFDNGCRIQTQARSKEPAIGFTVDLLYFDEFAHIPKNIIEPYYRSAVPTVAAIDNSKIIITSTPKGYNLFHSLWEAANKDEDDPDKGPHKPLKVLWWQVKGRRDTWVKPIDKICKKYKVNPKNIIKWLKSLGYKIYEKEEDGVLYYKIKFDIDNEEKTSIHSIRNLRYNTIPITEICKITNWKEVQTKLINGEENFKQEFEVKFITGDKSLFNDIDMERLKRSQKEFKHFKIPQIEKRFKISYENLKFINDQKVFDLNKAKDYYIAGGIDFSEGLGGDYTVLSLYKIKMKSKKEIQKNRNKFESIYDFFQLEQIGTFRSNHYSVEEFSTLFYILAFDVFDPEKVKFNFEYNIFGGEFLAYLPNVFDGINNFSTFVFARFKHSKESTKTKLGHKVNTNKNSLVKDYQTAIKKQNIIIHDPKIIGEMELFTRHNTPSGNYTYKAESGNDDTVMSVIHSVALLNNNSYKNLIQQYIEMKLSEEDKNFIYGIIIKEDDSLINSYQSIIGNRKKIIKNPNKIKDPSKMYNLPIKNKNIRF